MNGARVARRLLAAALAFGIVEFALAQDLYFGGLSNRGRIDDIYHYRGGAWLDVKKNELPITWYRINAEPGTKHIRLLRAVRSEVDASIFDRTSTEVELWHAETDYRHAVQAYGDIRIGWVASDPSGYALGEFEGLARINKVEDERGIPDPIKPLISQLQEKWNEAAWGVLAKFVAKENQANLKSLAKSIPLENLTIKRAVWRRSEATLFYFSAQKLVKSPHITHHEHGVLLYYRGWAVHWPDGRIDWPKTAAEDSEQYETIYPHAVIDLDARHYLLASRSIQEEKGMCSYLEVFELVKGKFGSRGAFREACING